MRYTLLFMIQVYRALSPALSLFARSFGFGCDCKYPVSCSKFAIEKLRNSPSLFEAVNEIIRRILSCGPWLSAFKRT